MRAVVGGGAVHAETNVDTSLSILLNRRDARGESHIGGGTVCHATVVFRKDFYFFVINPHRVREPDVVADPTHFLHVPNGTMSEHLHTELFFVFGLGKMSVQMYAIL